MGGQLYNSEFFTRLAANSLDSARIVVPLVMALTPARSVVDIGCGVGSWLKAFAENGAHKLQGFDVDYVDRARLLIEVTSFTATDLQRPFAITGHYDLAVCLEVLEHTPAKFARRLVATMTAAAPVVLFSAAIPGQHGRGHVNERWPGYWRKLFARYGFAMIDALRPQIRHDRRVMWWYRQNLLIFANAEALAANPSLAEWPRGPARDLDWIHRSLVHGLNPPPTASDEEWISAGALRAQRPLARRLLHAIRGD